MNGFADMSQPKEVIMLQKGTSCDVIGSELHLIDKQFQNSVWKTILVKNLTLLLKHIFKKK